MKCKDCNIIGCPNTLIKQRIDAAALDAVPPGTRHTLIRRKEFIKGATFALQNQWISVDERLPKGKEDVFVRNEYGGCTAAWYSRKTKDWHLTCGEICGDDIISSKITHWMEIPSLEGGEK